MDAVGLESAGVDCDVLEVLKAVGVLVILDVILDMKEEAGVVVTAPPTAAAVAGIASKEMMIKLVRRGEVIVIII